MLISDIMQTNVVSIPSSTSLAEARKIMEAHKIHRLPVIDHLLLEGIVTKDDLDKMGPSQLTTFSVNELVYMLNKITVKDVMHKDVITVPADTTIEEAVEYFPLISISGIYNEIIKINWVSVCLKPYG